jgi:hypothetical protein
MKKHLFGVAIVVPALLALAACSSEAPPVEKAEAKKEPEKVAGPMTGKEAFYEMYKPAREWATDIQALSLKSEAVPDQPVADGKAAAWTAVFVSPSKMEMRTITWALAPFGEYRKGINAGQPVRWGGATTKSKPFSMTEVTLDSDAAQKAAAEDPKGSVWLKSNAGKPLSFYLGAEQRFPAPVWVVAWGNSKEGYSKYLNAATGQDAR